MKKFLVLFVIAFLLWTAVTWSFEPTSLVLGLLVTAAVAFFLQDVELEEAPLLLMPHRILWALAYVPVLFFYVVKANLDVAYRVLHPALPIRPGIIRARTRLTSLSARVLLANSITLTPGTLSVDLVGDTLYIHRIHVPEEEPSRETEGSIGTFETFIRRIFE